jgi:lipoate-protein ligase A
VHWRLLLTGPQSGVENMALDEALLGRARETGESVFRVYSWSRPTLSFGRHQSAHDTYDATRLRARGIDVVRRPTGGRALLHHRELTYSVTAPVIAGEPLAESYTRINRLLIDALGRLGVAVSVAAPAVRAPSPTGAPCFETPTAGELVVGARKLVGSAQYRERDALLQHGSILVDDDQSLLPTLATQPIALVAAPATLRDVMGRAPEVAELTDALFAAVRAREDSCATPLAMEPQLLATMRDAEHRYRDDAWTWRR